MTPELKEKISNSIKEYLTTNGWPASLPADQIISTHLPHIWRKLETEGHLTTLLSRGFNYQHFVNIAVNKKREVDIMSEVERHFNFQFNGGGR